MIITYSVKVYYQLLTLKSHFSPATIPADGTHQPIETAVPTQSGHIASIAVEREETKQKQVNSELRREK